MELMGEFRTSAAFEQPREEAKTNREQKRKV
jgi:hypothetical protein